MPSKKPKTKTSISVDADLWDNFNTELMNRWRERSYSRGLERVMAEWIQNSLDAGQPTRHAELAENARRALRTQGSYAMGTTVKPKPDDDLADFELSVWRELEGKNIPETAKADMVRQMMESVRGAYPSNTVDFVPVGGRAELVSAKPHLQLEGIPELTTDPTITPQNDHERTVVQSVLAFERDPNLPAEFREILYVLLRRWVPDSYKAGKKTA